MHMCVKFIVAINFVLLYFHSHPVAPYNAMISNVTMNNIVIYTCYADGGPRNSYQWIRLRENKTVSMTQKLTLDNTDLLDGGDYQCIIANKAGNNRGGYISLNGKMY